LGIVNVDFNATSHLLVIYSAFIKYFKKWEYSEAVHQLFIDFKKLMIQLGWNSYLIWYPHESGMADKNVSE
jgi:hypothetical protein